MPVVASAGGAAHPVRCVRVRRAAGAAQRGQAERGAGARRALARGRARTRRPAREGEPAAAGTPARREDITSGAGRKGDMQDMRGRRPLLAFVFWDRAPSRSALEAICGAPQVVLLCVAAQAHFSRLALPVSDYITDTKSVLDQSIRILQAMVDIAAHGGWLATTLHVMHTLQMTLQVSHRSARGPAPAGAARNVCPFKLFKSRPFVLYGNDSAEQLAQALRASRTALWHNLDQHSSCFLRLSFYDIQFRMLGTRQCPRRLSAFASRRLTKDQQ